MEPTSTCRLADRIAHPVQLPDVDGFQPKSPHSEISANLSPQRTVGGRLPDPLHHACSTSTRNWLATRDSAARHSRPGSSPGPQLWLAVRIRRRFSALDIQLLKRINYVEDLYPSSRSCNSILWTCRRAEASGRKASRLYQHHVEPTRRWHDLGSPYFGPVIERSYLLFSR